MSRRTSDPWPVEQVLRRGYFVHQLSDHHWRIQGKVNFWPSTERWHDPNGYKFESKGRGVKKLLTYLAETYGDPIGAA